MRRLTATTLALALISALPAHAQNQQSSGEGQTTLGPAVFIAVDGDKAFRVSDWIGAPVRLTGSGDEVGEVENLMLASDGSTVAAILGVGGFLGIGEKNVAVDINSLSASYVEGEILLDLNATREQLDHAEPVIIEE